MLNNLKCLQPDDVVMNSQKDQVKNDEFLNVPKYELPRVHSYPKNPFSAPRSGVTVNYNMQPGAFNVGLKF